VASLVFACRNTDPVGPGIQAVTGSYHATTFITVRDGQSFDHIANGSTINIVLTPQGTTTGAMHIASGSGYIGSDVNLGGTWQLDRWFVTFEHPAETFLSEIVFTYNAGYLAGDHTITGTQFLVVLTRD
jgi:hypothetical protein